MINFKYLSIFSLFSLFCATVFWGMANLFTSPKSGVICTVMLTVTILFYCLADLSKRIGFTIFASCLFTFQLAGIVFPILIGDDDWMMGFTDAEYVKICNCIFVTCVTLFFATSFFEKYRLSLRKNDGKILAVLDDSHFRIEYVQKWSWRICIVSCIISIIGEAQRMIYVIINGYMAMYGDYSLSPIVTRMLIISKASLFIGLSANPTKRRAILYFLWGLPVVFMNLVEGQRSAIVEYVLFFMYYFYVYKQWKGEKITKFERKEKNRKLIFVALATICIATPLLYIYGYTRVGRLYERFSNPFVAIINFFAEQGESAKLIGYAIHYKGQLPGICYSLGGIVDRIQGNNPVAYTVDAALKSNNFGNIMSYMESSYNFLTLHFGVGSSYIAEVYYDFGYIGLIVVNIIIAYLLKRLTSYKQVGVLGKSLLFMLFYYIILIPRNSLALPIINIFSTSTVLTTFIIFFLSRKRNL